jgi:hypothetical protein
MSFMTVVIFSWILFLTIFTIYELGSFDNNVDLFYMIKREKRQQDDYDDSSPIIFAYTAVIAAIVVPHMNQID